MSTRSRTFSLRAMIMCASASAVAAPPMSFFILSMPAVGLDVEAAGVETDAFADQRHMRMLDVAPRHVDQPRLAGGGAADGVDERKILVQQLVADDGGDAGVVPRREFPRGLFELRRAHIVSRRIDEIARQGHGLDHVLQLLAIDALRQIELDRMRIGLAVAGEAIGAERKASAASRASCGSLAKR